MTTTPTPLPLPVVLAGGRGHGHWHLSNLRRLQAEGLVRLVGVCDLAPLTDAELDGFGPVAQSTDFAALLESTSAAVAIVCTPIHSHRDLALVAAERGVHLLLEKPPAPSFAEFQRISEGMAAAGVACQVGFQSLGSHALAGIAEALEDGLIGEVKGIGAAGAWARDEAYYRRAPWAGHRLLDGTDVNDGVLTNPLAHAVATALAIDGSTRAEDVAHVAGELFRANDIESDDTSCLRVTTARGTTLTIAVTLCAEQPGEPYVRVHGTRGQITFWYKQDQVLLQRAGHGPVETRYARTDLLHNLVEHLTLGADLLVTPEHTGAFMRIVEAIRLMPAPRRLPPEAWRSEPGPSAPRRVVLGVDALVEKAADSLSLFSELGARWARPEEVPAR